MTYVVSLISNPGKPILKTVLVTELCEKWAGRSVKLLCPDVAAEFVVDLIPIDFEEVWTVLYDLGIDLIIQPRNFRKKQLLVADMDSTIIEQECLDELADFSGLGDLVKGITKRAMNGEIPFEQALKERVALLKGESAQIIEQTWQSRITFTPGARELVGTMRANGAYCALVSGGFTEFTDRLATALGFHENHANTLSIENNILTGEVGLPILGKETKLEVLTKLVSIQKLKYSDSIAVGDGANDLDMLSAAGTGVAFRSHPIVAKQSKVKINHGDLTSLLYLQGYTFEDFVENI